MNELIIANILILACGAAAMCLMTAPLIAGPVLAVIICWSIRRATK